MLLVLSGVGAISVSAQDSGPRFRHVTTETEKAAREEVARQTVRDAREVRSSAKKIFALPDIVEEVEDVDSMLPRSVEQILADLPTTYPYMRYALRASGPWVISGYRPIPKYTLQIPELSMRNILGDSYTTYGPDTISMPAPNTGLLLAERKETGARPSNGLYFGDESDPDDFTPEEEESIMEEVTEIEEKPTLPPIAKGEYMPGWLREAYINRRIQEDMMYKMMVENPHLIQYAYWDLPEPPRLPEEDNSFTGFIRRLNLPNVDVDKAVISKGELGRYNWLHTVNAGLQLSQTYVSRNWYQGGNNYVAALLNLLWDVNLNQVYHPKLMLQSSLSYKLGLNTTPKSSLHRYQINTDILQWNLKGGLKAFTDKWYYSFNLLFKTQLLLNRADNSDDHKASFLSPGELNIGLGMTYNHQNSKKTFKLSLSISPVAYNLKTDIDSKINPTQFNIKEGRHTHSEYGSNIECNTEWRISQNVFWRSRIFSFSDYKTLLGDWENTFEFTINRFLSTQLYFHLRYDSTTPLHFETGWGKWQFKEILSFGLSYTFNTKP